MVIHAAYRALMLRYHPDQGGDLGKAQRLNEAYATLSDPRARRRYDRLWQLERHIAQLRAAEATPEPEAAVVTEPHLRAVLERPFTPVTHAGCGWMFDYTGVLRDSPHSRLWLKRFRNGDGLDADGFRMRVEAARLLRPLWQWQLDVFVAVGPGSLAEPFRTLLRESAGPQWR